MYLTEPVPAEVKLQSLKARVVRNAHAKLDALKVEINAKPKPETEYFHYLPGYPRFPEEDIRRQLASGRGGISGMAAFTHHASRFSAIFGAHSLPIGRARRNIITRRDPRFFGIRRTKTFYKQRLNSVYDTRRR